MPTGKRSNDKSYYKTKLKEGEGVVPSLAAGSHNEERVENQQLEAEESVEDSGWNTDIGGDPQPLVMPRAARG